MQKRRVATCAFYTDDKKILLQDRKKISKFGEEWGFFGGSLEKNETPEQAVVREIFEELEYHLIDFTFFKKYDCVLPNGQAAEEYVFISKFPEFEKFKQHEGDGMGLFTIDEVRKKLILLPAYKDMINDLENFLHH